MCAEELQELHEHAEHAKHDPAMARVTMTMAILAVVVATVTLLGHRAHTEEVLLQAQASDHWAQYQAKSIRRHSDEQLTDMIAVITAKSSDQAAKLQEKYQSEAERYRDDQKELDAEARKLEQETVQERSRADRYDLGEVFLEIALVVTSITLLSGNRAFWYAGMAMGAAGLVLTATGLMIH